MREPGCMSGRDERVRATVDAYDAVAADFAAKTAGLSAAGAAFLDRFLAELGSNRTVIDAGCGPGHHAAHMVDRGHRVVGLDRSQAMLAAVPGPVSAVRADLAAVPLVAGAADAIWSCAALIHVDADSLDDVLEEWERVVRPGGLVGFATSIGGEAGWEDPPAAPERVPEMPDGHRRWFVHHDADTLFEAVARRHWEVVHSSVRQGAREWLQIVAVTPS